MVNNDDNNLVRLTKTIGLSVAEFISVVIRPRTKSIVSWTIPCTWETKHELQKILRKATDVEAYISPAERISGCKRPGPCCRICGSVRSRLGKSQSAAGSGAGEQPDHHFISLKAVKYILKSRLKQMKDNN